MIPYAIVRTPTSKRSNPPLTDSNGSEKTLLIHLSCYYFFLFGYLTYIHILFFSPRLYFSVFSFRRFFPPFHAQKKHTEKDLRGGKVRRHVINAIDALNRQQTEQRSVSTTQMMTMLAVIIRDNTAADKKKVNKSFLEELSIHKLIFTGPCMRKSSRGAKGETLVPDEQHTGTFLPYHLSQ